VSAIPGRSLGRQRGAAAVELALVAAIFLMLLIGIMETGRVLFYWNTAAEATRLGARLAVVCDIADAGAVKDAMGEFFPLFSPGAIDIAYTPAGCTVETCTEVTVSIAPWPRRGDRHPVLPVRPGDARLRDHAHPREHEIGVEPGVRELEKSYAVDVRPREAQATHRMSKGD
jgi:Flp pilus assembly protein TadG